MAGLRLPRVVPVEDFLQRLSSFRRDSGTLDGTGNEAPPSSMSAREDSPRWHPQREVNAIMGENSTTVPRQRRRGKTQQLQQHMAELEREIRRLHKAKDPRRRVEAIRALEQHAQHNLPMVLEALSQRLQDPSKLVRIAALQATKRLAKPGEPVAMNAVATILEFDDWEWRSAAARRLPELGKLHPGDPQAVVVVDQCMQEKMPTGPDAAQEALLGVAGDMDPAITETLTELMGSDVRYVRLTAASTMGRITVRGDSNPLQAVASRLGHHKQEVRRAGVRVLRSLSPPQQPPQSSRKSRRSFNGLGQTAPALEVPSATSSHVVRPPSRDHGQDGSQRSSSSGKRRHMEESSTPVPPAEGLSGGPAQAELMSLAGTVESQSDDSETPTSGIASSECGSLASHAPSRRLWPKVRGAAILAMMRVQKQVEQPVREESIAAAVAQLEEDCQSTDERRDAIAALAKEAPKAKSHHLVIPPLQRLCSDESWLIRQTAVDAFARVASPKDEVTIGIVAALRSDRSWQVRKAVPPALREFGRGWQVALEAVIDLIKDWKDDVAVAALNALPAVASLGDRRAIEVTVAAVTENPQPRVRAVARRTLDGVARQADPVLIELVAARLEHDEASVRNEAIGLLVREVGGHDKSAVIATVAEKMTHWNGHVRAAVLKVITGLHTEHPVAVEAMSAGLQDEDPSVRAAAVQAFARIGRAAQCHTLSAVAALLSHPLPHAREAAIEAAVKVARFDDNNLVVEPLTRLLEDEHKGIREQAREALHIISPSEQGIRAQIQALQEAGMRLEQKEGREAAIKVTKQLAEVGPAGAVDVVDADALAIVSARLGHSDPEVRHTVLELLSALAPEGHRPSLDGVLDLFRDSDNDIRSDAVKAFVQLAPKKVRQQEQEAIRLLSMQVALSHAGARACAVSALSQVARPDDQEVQEEILARLSDDNAAVREAAVAAIITLESRRQQADGVGACPTAESTLFKGVDELLRQAPNHAKGPALEALKHIAPRKDARALVRAAAFLEDFDATIRQQAFSALQVLAGDQCSGSGDGSGHIPLPGLVAIAARLGHHAEEVRQLAGSALEYIASNCPLSEAIAAVAARLNSESWPERQIVLKVLSSLVTGPLREMVMSMEKVLAKRAEAMWASNATLVLKRLEVMCGRAGSSAGCNEDDEEVAASCGRARIRWHRLHGVAWAEDAVRGPNSDGVR